MLTRTVHKLLLVGLVLSWLFSTTSTSATTPIFIPVKPHTTPIVTAFQSETITNNSFERSDDETEVLTLETEGQSFSYKPNAHKSLLEQNQDYAGWIQIQGTKVNYPFLKGDDNDFYLNRNFSRQLDKKGSIFMDYRNIGFQFSPHVILYGHNMRDGSMFGDLDLYKTESFALNNDIIEITDLYGSRIYQIYASYYDEADADLIQTNLSTDDMNLLIRDHLERSDVDYNQTVTSDDQILTLITCSYEVDQGRFYIHAKAVQ